MDDVDDLNVLIRQAVEHSTDMIGMADLEGRFTWANQAFLRAYGGSLDDIVGTHFGVLLSENPPDLLRELQEGLLQDSGWRGECLSGRADGTAFPVSLNVGPVKDEDGRVVGSFGIAQDITERKRAQAELQESEELFRQLAENIREVFFTIVPDPFQVTYVSPAYDEIWGQSRQRLYDDANMWSAGVHPDDREAVEHTLAESLGGSRMEVEFRVVRPDRTERWIRAQTFPVRAADGTLGRVVGVCEDITRRREEALALRKAHEQLNEALNASESQVREAAKLSDAIDILQSCQTAEEAFTIAADALPSVMGAPAGALYMTSPSRDTVEAAALWGDDPKTERVFAPDQCWALRRGKLHVVEDPASPLRCGHVNPSEKAGYLCLPLVAQGETLGVLHVEGPDADAQAGAEDGTMSDLVRRAGAVGERLALAIANIRLRDALRRQSIRDPLTGLFNRRYMEESLEREFRRAVRLDQPLSVVLLDIDLFKQFNDTFGHQAGDTVLRALGDLLSRCTRVEDVACRYGGEEFAIILNGGGVDEATQWAERVREELKHLVVKHANQVVGTLTLSFGVASYPQHADAAEKLIQAADQALYRAKTEGRDRIVVSAEQEASS